MIKYPLATSTWDDDELEAIQSVIESGSFTMGKYVSDYEKMFANYFGSKYAVMVSSGSSANLLMIASLFYSSNKKYRLKRGDEVIVPAVSWSTTYFPLYQYGLKIKFVDIDVDTLNINIQQLENAISSKTRAILAVNLLGNPNDFIKINSLIENKNILLLEDNCESMGASYKGQMTGTFGVMGSFSSFFSHHIATMEGGAIVTDDEEIYHILLCLRAHGWTRNLPEKNYVTGLKSRDLFEESFKFVLPGYNARPLEMSGAIGLKQLDKLPKFIKNRRQNGDYFKKIFFDHPFLKIQEEIGESSWFGFSFVIKQNSKISRKKILEELTKQGIEYRPIVSGNFVKNKVIEFFDYNIHNKLSNAEYIDKNGFFVGNHQFDIKDKINWLKKTLDKL